jgi:outer membrane protein assembly factor BamD
MSFANALRSAKNRASSTKALAARASVVIGLGIALAGCETLANLNPLDRPERYETQIVEVVPAQEMYNDGLSRLERGDPARAAERFAELERRHPNTDWARRALVMKAYSNFTAGAYDDAIGDSSLYLQLHPNTAEAAYAQYILAMSYYNQIPDITRDQERTGRAILAMQALIERYPRSEYVEDTRAKLQFAYDQLAGKEMSGWALLSRTPQELHGRRSIASATSLGKYQTTRHIGGGACYRLTEAYMAMGITDEAQTAAAVLGHNFPDSQWYRDSYVLLQSGGLEPRENTGSWISRAFTGFTRTIGL